MGTFEGVGESASPKFLGGLLIKRGEEECDRFKYIYTYIFIWRGYVKRDENSITNEADTLDDTMQDVPKNLIGPTFISV